MKIIPILLSLILLFPIISAYGAYGFDDKWYCGPSLEGELTDYTKSIDSFNGVVEINSALIPGATDVEVGNHVIGPGLELLGKKA